MSTFTASTPVSGRPPSSDAVFKVVSLLLGLAVGVLVVVAAALAAYGEAAKDEANAAAAEAQRTAAAHDQAAAATAATPSFAGKTAANAQELAAAHVPYDAALPAAPPGPVAHVNMTVKDMTIEIAPGVKYTLWAFDEAAGTAPGPVIHVREGQRVHFTITNGGSIPHSMDFHAARIAPNKAFKDVAPGESFSFSFVAGDPGVYMYHCGTKPVLAHIANGMYGAIVVSPVEQPLPRVDREYVLVSSEWYLSSDGIEKPAQLDMDKARRMQPDWATFNGYAGQYVAHPLQAEPGETVRFWVVAAGPTLDTDFHVVGTVFERAWLNGDVTSPPQRGIQTALVPAGGGAVFDVKIDEPGLYPFVSHAFAHVELGQVGLLEVGDPGGTMSH